VCRSRRLNEEALYGRHLLQIHGMYPFPGNQFKHHWRAEVHKTPKIRRITAPRFQIGQKFSSECFHMC
jgi:hypothetical protein